MARELPRWHNAGVSPPESLKVEGYKKGDKIPYQYMNWFMHNSYKALEELQINKVEQQALESFRDELLNEISNRVLVFDSAASMRATDLTAGAVVETLGYYTTGDGGGARYLIVNNVQNPDGYFELRMSNNLVARLLPSATNFVNIKQLGGRPQNDTTKYDNKQYVDAYLARLDANTDRSARLKLYIPSGIWCFSPTRVQNTRGFSVFGDVAIPSGTNSVQGTIINALNDNQTYVWDIGRFDRLTHNFDIGNLSFSACEYIKEGSDYVAGNLYTVTDYAVTFAGLNHGIIYPMTFLNLKGTALEVSSVRDTLIQRLTFKNIGDFTTPVLRLAAATDYLPTEWMPMFNVNYGVIEFENVAGDLIQSDVRADSINNTIDTINIHGTPYGTTIPVTDATYNDGTANKLSVIRVNGALSNLTVGEINLHSFAASAAVVDAAQYVYDTVIGTYADLYTITMKVISINTSNNLGKDYSILRNFVGTPNSRSTFLFGEVSDMNSTYKGNYNVTRFPTIYVSNSISKTFAGRDLLRGSWIPAREATRRITLPNANLAGMLHRAEGSESPDQLIVRPNTWLQAGNDEVFYLKNNKFSDLRMRFKFTVGAIIWFNIYEVGKPEVSQTVSLTGTGDWTISTILTAAQNVFGESATLTLAMGLQRDVDIDLFQWVYLPTTD